METQRLRTFIGRHERLVQDLDNRILQEEENIQTANSAILNLQDVIPRVELALQAQEEISESLEKAMENFKKMSIDGNTIPADEPQSRSLRETVISGITAYVARGGENVRTQLSASNIEAGNTRSQLLTMKEELTGWVFCRDLSVDSQEYLKGSKDRLKSIIDNAQSAFSKEKSLPKEIWERIFMFYSRRSFYTAPVAYYLLPFGALSHVCRLWRRICLEGVLEPCDVPLHTRIGWQSFDPAIITNFVARRRTPSTLLLTLSVKKASQILASLQLAKVTQERNIEAVARELADGPRYHLSIVIQDWSVEYSQILNEIPFNRPTHMIIRSTNHSTASYPTITGFYPHSTVTHLTLINILRYVGLQTNSPSLKHLVIQFGSFKEGIIKYFEPPLHITSLHVICLGCYDIDSSSSIISLPNLQELGLTLPQPNLVGKLVTPSRLRLTLYGLAFKRFIKPSWGSYERLFGTITHLTFEGWKKYMDIVSYKEWGVTEIIHDNLGAFKKLNSATFTNSFVDGTSLVKLVQSNNSPEKPPTSLTLNGITIDGCTGITRYDCEEIIQHVQKLRVIL
jgi:hypothetical protein